MSKPTPSFPAAAWNGTTADRPDYVGDFRSPDQADYDRLVEEIKAMQNDLRSYTPVVFQITIADGAGDTTFTIPYACKVIDVWAIKTAANGGSGDTVTVKNNAGSAITSAIVLNVTDTLVARTTLINDATQSFTAGQTLTVTAAHVTNNACVVNVLAMKV